MINPLNITNIVRNTLTDMDVYTPAMEMLIKGTFLVESDLTDLYSIDGIRHGLMMMRGNIALELCGDYLRFKPILKEAVHTATGIDIVREDSDVILAELDTNIRFMVAMTYVLYNNKNEDDPEADIEQIALFYRKHYDTDKTSDIEKFVDYYKEVFIN